MEPEKLKGCVYALMAAMMIWLIAGLAVYGVWKGF
jgi:hypothetical protein